MSSSRVYVTALIALAIGGGLSIWVGQDALMSALGWLLLAAIAGIVATGRYGRRAIAVIIAISSATLLISGWSLTWNGLALLVAAVCGGFAAVATWVGGADWPGLSRRYARGSDRPADPWSELDAGRDPTT